MKGKTLIHLNRSEPMGPTRFSRAPQLRRRPSYSISSLDAISVVYLMFKRTILTAEAKNIPTPVVRTADDHGAVATRARIAIPMEITNAMQIFRLLVGVLPCSLMFLIVFRNRRMVAASRMAKANQTAMFSVEFIMAVDCYYAERPAGKIKGLSHQPSSTCTGLSRS
jgi:hypothetical protein